MKSDTVVAALQVQLIRLPRALVPNIAHSLISDAQCIIRYISSKQRYRRSPKFWNGNMLAHIDMNLLPSAYRGSRAFIFLPK